MGYVRLSPAEFYRTVSSTNLKISRRFASVVNAGTKSVFELERFLSIQRSPS